MKNAAETLEAFEKAIQARTGHLIDYDRDVPPEDLRQEVEVRHGRKPMQIDGGSSAPSRTHTEVNRLFNSTLRRWTRLRLLLPGRR